MKASPLRITTQEFFKMYRFLVTSYEVGKQDSIMHNARHNDDISKHIIITPFPYTGILDYLRKTFKHLSESSHGDVHWIDRRGRVHTVIKCKYKERDPYKHPKNIE